MVCLCFGFKVTWEPVLPCCIQAAQRLPREGCRSVGMPGWFLILSLCPKHDCHCPLSQPQGSEKNPATLEFHLVKTCLEASFLCSSWLSLVLGLPCTTSAVPALGMPQVSLTARILMSVGFSCSCMTWGPVGLSTHKQEQLPLLPAPCGVQPCLSVCRLKMSNRLKSVP